MLKLFLNKLPKYHWQRDIPDARDHIYNSATLGPVPPTLAARLDLRNYCSPIENQGQLGSCTANAIAGLVEYLDRKNNKQLDVSRLFIYYQERLLEGTVNYDSGAYIRDGIKAVNQYGAPLESLWPYIVTRFQSRPTTAAYTDAAKRRAGAYQKITTRTAGIKTALNQGYPVVIGFDVYASFEGNLNNTTGMMPYPGPRERLLGGHAVAVVGYDDNLNGGRLICRNSWGTSWGDRGYFYMPYQVTDNANMSDDFWIITSVNNP